MKKRWIRLEDNTITQVSYLNEDTPDFLNRVNPGLWISVGDADIPNEKYDLAQEGGFYDSESDICRPPKPFPSWVPDGNNWVAPIAPPNNDATGYLWNESEQSWIQDPSSGL